MTKIKLCTLYWDTIKEEAFLEESKNINKLDDTELMDAKDDLIIEIRRFFDRISSKWKNTMEEIKNG